jgi:hypothetical protein
MNGAPPSTVIGANALLITYVLIAYLGYFYLPNAFYRFWFEQRVSIGRRRDVSQLEDFVQSGLPAIGFNLVTIGILLIFWAARFMGVAIWRSSFQSIMKYAPLPTIDTNVLLCMVGQDQRPLLDHVRGGISGWTISYVVILYAVSALMGFRYGWQCRLEYVYRRLRDEKGVLRVRMRTVDTDSKSARPPVSRNVGLRDLIDGLNWWFGNLFFQEYIDELFPYVATKPFVFVRTTDKRLYYGRFQSYEKGATGSVESITLSDVHRYCYDEIKECLARGDNPVHDFGGPLLIRWNMVADINIVPEERIAKIKARYAAAIAAYKALPDEERAKLDGVVPYRTEDDSPLVEPPIAASSESRPRPQ